MKTKQPVLFGPQFFEKYAGPLISDTSVAITELVANAWDAYATDVKIQWPKRSDGVSFSIRDNGKGMTEAEFNRRWVTLDYDRTSEDGDKSVPPPDLVGHSPRKPYGRNGRGRHAAFRFSDPYLVRTWKNGTEVTFEVRRGDTQPFIVEKIGERKNVSGHGTEITATAPSNVTLGADDARQVLGTRFLADPNFSVSLDGKPVSFEDIPPQHLQRHTVDVPGFGKAELVVIDMQAPEKSLRQHGIVWRVSKRMVGNPGWVGFDHERILDGRTSEAKRLQFLVSADFLADVVAPDWTEFVANSDKWQATREAVHSKIRELLSAHSAERRKDLKAAVKDSLAGPVRHLAPLGRERWNLFVDQVVDSCPTISSDEIKKVAAILVNLEASTSKYALIERLHGLPPGDMDALNQILKDWSVRLAKDALDEIQNRLKLIQELDIKLRDATLAEVADLQPLLERSLWVFGPEFESIEFTSNRGMTEVIQSLFGANIPGSRRRPDFAILPDGSVGLYSRDSHDLDHEVAGVARLVIVEIKKVGVPIGSTEKNQPWNYAKELIQKGMVGGAKVTCFVLGAEIEPGEDGEVTQAGGQVVIRPMTYSTFVKRAEARMLGLRRKLQEAPFLKEQDVDATEYSEGDDSGQQDLLELASEAV